MDDLNAMQVVHAAPLRKQVADNIRSAIISGKLAPGTRLKEGELCAWTGVSRTAVREALRQLEAEGIVDNIPNRGPVVATVTPEDARSHYEVRAVLEALVARSAALAITEVGEIALRQLRQRLVASFEEKSLEDMLVVKYQLEELLAAISGNALLRSFLDLIHARLAYLRPMVLAQPESVRENVEEVSLIIDAILRRDPDAAAAAAHEHAQRGAKRTLAVLLAKANQEV